MAELRAVVEVRDADALDLQVMRAADSAVGFSESLYGPRGDDWRPAVAARLAQAGYRVAGPWQYDDELGGWTADAERA